MKPVHQALTFLVCSLVVVSANAQTGSHQILGRSPSSLSVEAMDRGANDPTVTSGYQVSGNQAAPTDARQLPSASFPTLTGRQTASDGTGVEKEADSGVMTGPAVTVTSSLALVLGLFAGLIWLTRKFGTRSLSSGSIPTEVMQSLGSTALDARTRVTMLRCGNRIFVVSQSPTGVQPIGEITNPDEVRELTASCLGDSKQAFASTLASIEKEPPAKGFAGTGPEPTPRSRGRLFATA